MKEITIDGEKYVRKLDLLRLFRDHKRKTDNGTEPGFICDNKDQRMAGYMALNHLQAVIFHDEAQESLRRSYHMIALDDDEKGRMYFSHWIKMKEDTPPDMKTIMRHNGMKIGDSMPVFSDDSDDGMLFKHKEMAEKTIEKIEKDYDEFKGHMHAFPVFQPGSAKRLLEAIFGEPID